jgi:hypothetical protein
MVDDDSDVEVVIIAHIQGVRIERFNDKIDLAFVTASGVWGGCFSDEKARRLLDDAGLTDVPLPLTEAEIEPSA